MDEHIVDCWNNTVKPSDHFKGNIHGHLHANHVMQPVLRGGNIVRHVPDERYGCVSVENINYTPIAFEEVKKWFL